MIKLPMIYKHGKSTVELSSAGNQYKVRYEYVDKEGDLIVKKYRYDEDQWALKRFYEIVGFIAYTKENEVIKK